MVIWRRQNFKKAVKKEGRVWRNPTFPYLYLAVCISAPIRLSWVETTANKYMYGGIPPTFLHSKKIGIVYQNCQNLIWALFKKCLQLILGIIYNIIGHCLSNLGCLAQKNEPTGAGELINFLMLRLFGATISKRAPTRFYWRSDHKGKVGPIRAMHIYRNSIDAFTKVYKSDQALKCWPNSLQGCCKWEAELASNLEAFNNKRGSAHCESETIASQLWDFIVHKISLSRRFQCPQDFIFHKISLSTRFRQFFSHSRAW